MYLWSCKSWRFLKNEKYEKADTVDSTVHQDVGGDHTGWNLLRWLYHAFMFLLKLAVVAAVVGGAWWYYKRRQRNNNMKMF